REVVRFEGYGYGQGSGAIREVLGRTADGTEEVAYRLHFTVDRTTDEMIIRGWHGESRSEVGRVGPIVPNVPMCRTRNGCRSPWTAPPDGPRSTAAAPVRPRPGWPTSTPSPSCASRPASPPRTSATWSTPTTTSSSAPSPAEASRAPSRP